MERIEELKKVLDWKTMEWWTRRKVAENDHESDARLLKS